MSTKKVEEQDGEDEQQHSQQDGNPSGLGSLNELRNLGTEEVSVDTRTSSSSSETSTDEEISPGEHLLSFNTVLSIFNIIIYQCFFTSGYLARIEWNNLNTISSPKEFTVLSVQFERIRVVNGFLRKATNRCRTMVKSNLDKYLRSVVRLSSRMNAEKIAKIPDSIHLLFESRRFIYKLEKFTTEIEERLDSYAIELSKAKSKNERRMKERKNKVLSPEDMHNLVTPTDENVSITLTILLNSSENILLPELRKLGVLPESTLPTRSYSCKKTPQSIREHMVILEGILSDANDLLHYEEAPPKSNFKAFLCNSRKWMDECICVHKKITTSYFASSLNVQKLDIVTTSVTFKEYDDMMREYIQIRVHHNKVKKLIFKSQSLDQNCLKDVSRDLLKYSDAVDLEELFVSMLRVFCWLPTVSQVFVRLIKLDDKYLDHYINELTKLERV